MTVPIHDPFDPRYFSTLFKVERDPSQQWDKFTIVTACNPMGQLQPSTVNQQRTLRLRQALKTAGCTVIEVVGCAPDGSHAELGFAIQCTEAQARRVQDVSESEVLEYRFLNTQTLQAGAIALAAMLRCGVST